MRDSRESGLSRGRDNIFPTTTDAAMMTRTDTMMKISKRNAPAP